MLKTKVYKPDEVKILDEDRGLVSATVSTEQVDRDGDVIRAAGWDFSNFEKHPVLLANHDYSSLKSQIGVWEEVAVIGTEMKGTARFFIGKGNSEADYAFELAKEKALAFSVGFIPDLEKAKPLSKDGAGSVTGTEFNGQELLEISAVTVPSNPAAIQRIIKNQAINQLITEMAEQKLTQIQKADEDAPAPSLDEVVEAVIARLDERDQAAADADAESEAEQVVEPEPEEEEEEKAQDLDEGADQESEVDVYALAEAGAEAALEEFVEEALDE